MVFDKATKTDYPKKLVVNLYKLNSDNNDTANDKDNSHHKCQMRLYSIVISDIKVILLISICI